MFDLKVRSESEFSSVPVPLPGRVMLFAGPGGEPAVRDSAGVVRGFGGAPGAGFKSSARIDAVELALSVEKQKIFDVDIAGLMTGDVMTIHAPFDVVCDTGGGRPIPIKVEIYLDLSTDNGATWVSPVVALLITPRADVVVEVLARGDDLRVTLFIDDSVNTRAKRSAVMPVGQSLMARAVWIKWADSSAATVTAWPVHVSVS